MAGDGEVTANGLDRIRRGRIHFDGDSALRDDFIRRPTRAKYFAYQRCPTESDGLSLSPLSNSFCGRSPVVFVFGRNGKIDMGLAQVAVQLERFRSCGLYFRDHFERRSRGYHEAR